MDIELRIKAMEAIDFLNSHPAFAYESGDSICSGLSLSLSKCCKHGLSHYAGETGVDVYRHSEDWDKWKHLYEKEDEEEEEDTFDSVSVPYVEMYGEPWKLDHIEYWYELTFFVFSGDPYDKTASHEFQNWNRFGGPHGGANSFEEAVIDAAEKVKEVYGDFNDFDSFRTEAEKKNNEKEKFCFSKPTDNPKYTEMIFNDRYINNTNGLINLRWLKWFMATDIAKEDWSYSFEEWQSFIDKIDTLEPIERKQVLAEWQH